MPSPRGATAAAVAAAAAAVLAALPSSAVARDDAIASFDGTRIVLHFWPAAKLRPGARAPTVMVGPGWSSPGATDPDEPTGPGAASIGLGPLRRAGLNVLTWDPRGFGGSGGTVTIDGPDKEGRDVQALIDYVATQPEARLDRKGDPRLGMAGGSYGGGIQLVAAALDHRIDAIVPSIAWHSLASSLYQDRTFKSGWGGLLYLAGRTRGRLDPHIDSGYLAGSTTGRLSAGDEAWYRSRGPGNALVSRIRAPTLLIQGTVDTLFPLDEAVANYRQLRRTGKAPVRMLWFCGGHGTCLTPAGDTSLVQSRTLAWFDRYLLDRRRAASVPGFEWVDQDGAEHTARAYPPKAGTPLTASASGRLALSALGGSGPLTGTGTSASAAAIAGTGATKADNAVDVAVRARSRTTQVVGAPMVTLRYKGTATEPDARLYGQVVDDATGKVLGNLVTPIPVTLDGAEHTVTRPLELVAAALRPGRRFTVQIVASTTAYDAPGAPFATGSVELDSVAVSLPVVRAARTATTPRPKVVRVERVSARRYRVTVRATSGRLEDVRITVRTVGGDTLGTARLASLGTKPRTAVVKLTRDAGARVRVLVKARVAASS